MSMIAYRGNIRVMRGKLPREINEDVFPKCRPIPRSLCAQVLAAAFLSV
jgi:hypothetical protein